MKKVSVITAIFCMLSCKVFSQTSLLATLSHDGTITTYYGATALKEAMEAASAGDAITLSAGQFQAVNITKNVIIRGAGMNVRNDSIGSHEATLMQGNFEINITDSLTGRLSIEGVYFTSTMSYAGTMRNPLFMKCRFGTIKASTAGTLANSSFIHCRIANGITLSDNSNACMINCVVWNPYNLETTASNFEFDNCVVRFPEYNGTGNICAGNVINSYYKNCMIMVNDKTVGSDDKKEAIPSSCTAVNCVGCSNYGGLNSYCNDIFYNMWAKNNTNSNVAKPSSVLKSGGFTYSDNEKFELTDEAKTKYLGTDGTETGLYGGSLPYEEDPSTPQITKCDVAAKSTADGKLSVEIEVKAAEY